MLKKHLLFHAEKKINRHTWYVCIQLSFSQREDKSIDMTQKSKELSYT